jgi:hypothetical protein
VPLHPFLEFPGHRRAVSCDPAVLDIGDLGSKHRNQIAVGIPCRQWFVKDPASLRVFGADSEVRIEQGGGLPKQEFERPAAAGFGRLVVG